MPILQSLNVFDEILGLGGVGPLTECGLRRREICRRAPRLSETPSLGDLDCPDVGAVNFPVAAPDSHGFDGDYDGIGCEA
jgi:hypothetical protein